MHADIHYDILSTLSYYDIFNYPLRAEEVFCFLPRNGVTEETVASALDAAVESGSVYRHFGYYGLNPAIREHVERRLAMEDRARGRWKTARRMTHILKRFPFISSVIVTGTLSKNIHWQGLDIDYFIITKPNRLWIARTMLILFKKSFLLNSKQLFCLNYFISESALPIQDRNIFTATEIAHAKVLFNKQQFDAWLTANDWIHSYFPNLKHARIPAPQADNNHPWLHTLMGLFPNLGILDRLDAWLMVRWARIWQRRYPELTPEKRDALFRVRRHESKAHGPDFQTRILAAHAERCKRIGVNPERYQTRPHEHPAFT